MIHNFKNNPYILSQIRHVYNRSFIMGTYQSTNFEQVREY